MITKSQAGYLHVPRGDYDCDDCAFWIEPTRRCVLHGASDTIMGTDSCNYFTLGWPGTFGATPMGYFQKDQSGFMHSTQGFSCKRCDYWLRDAWGCQEVDKDSEGNDPSMIHPDGCCNLWQPDPIYGNMSSDALITVREVPR
jgi:hypothetical protein